MKTDTIAAIATGLTDSGIGIIRISGERAVEIGDRLFSSPSGKKILKNAESHRLYYGFFLNIDEVMAVVMKAPRSFTGEDTVEIQCHGGVLVMHKILDAILKAGARLAEPGEFTKRAFLNGRMDLSMAEAVIDVIRSQNDYALESSFNQLKGMLSERVKNLRADIIHEIAFIESALDDPEHISLEGYTCGLAYKIDGFLDSLKALIATADNGRLIKEGIDTVIVGKPNVGKSSLLNLILGEDRAIVTEWAGTTRDVLQETVRLGEISLNVMDTAGIRSTDDVVEKIGVEKAREYAKKADLILYVVDTSVNLDENDREIISLINREGKNVIVLLNKSDLENVVSKEDISCLFSGFSVAFKAAAAKTEAGSLSVSTEAGIQFAAGKKEEALISATAEAGIQFASEKKEEALISATAEAGIQFAAGKKEEALSSAATESEIQFVTEKKEEALSSAAVESGIQIVAITEKFQQDSKEMQNVPFGNITNRRKIRMVKSSAKNNEGLKELEEAIREMFFQGNIKSSNEPVIINMRHKEALQEAYDSLMLVKGSIQDGMPEDFYSIDLMSAYSSLGRIIGEEVDDDLVNEIFSKFCLGK